MWAKFECVLTEELRVMGVSSWGSKGNFDPA
jgi:hypothetical protein